MLRLAAVCALLALAAAQDPKPLPCSLPAPTAATPSTAAATDALTAGTPTEWAAVGGNEKAKLADMAALSFEDWLSKGLPGANATACTSANVGSYAVNVTAACKQVTPTGGSYSIEYTARFGCTVGPASALIKPKTGAAAAPAAALAAPAPAAVDAAAPGDKASVKVILRALVSQPPLRETAEGDLIKPKPAVDDVWLVSGSQATRALVEKKTVKTLAGAPASAEEAAEEGAGETRVPAGGAGGSSLVNGASAAVASIAGALGAALDGMSAMDARAAPMMMGSASAPRGGVVVITPASGMMTSSSGGSPYFDESHEMEGMDGDDDDSFGADDAASSSSHASSHSMSSSSMSHPADTIFKQVAPKAAGAAKPAAHVGGGARRLLAAA